MNRKRQLSDFFSQQSTPDIARSVLGKQLVYEHPEGIMSGYIVEAEAYLGQKDSAAHAYKGRRTPANEALYGPPGTIYIYLLHGRAMLDIAVQKKEVPQGILIRAIEPLDGRDLMEKNRKKHGFELTNGPGKFMEALGIHDKSLNRKHMGDAPLYIDLSAEREPEEIGVSARKGISRRGSGTCWPFRFFVKGNPYVSGIKKSEVNDRSFGWKENR
ncbi:DNA-3-methyladenine glycosylase [Sporolactobacillus sp. Y61]|uniref:Putative 3-methyladenine DNA glycosylase n=1 Tax=Sporolactobacillus sp. Y61 TaxID=3160863 RepID=A0AAU8ICL1_9BACL